MYIFLFEYILKCTNLYDGKTDFSASFLQSSVSHDHSEINVDFLLKKHFLLLLAMFKTVVLLKIFHRNWYFLSGFF